MPESLLLNKVTGLRSATLFKKRLWHRCFPVNFAKFVTTLKTPPVDASENSREQYKNPGSKKPYKNGSKNFSVPQGSPAKRKNCYRLGKTTGKETECKC